MHEALEQGGQHRVAHDHTADVLQPGAQPFDLPAAFITAPFTASLGRRLLAILTVRADQLDALLRQSRAARSAVRRPVINPSRQRVLEDALAPQTFDQGHLTGAGRVDDRSQWQTISGGLGSRSAASTLISQLCWTSHSTCWPKWTGMLRISPPRLGTTLNQLVKFWKKEPAALMRLNTERAQRGFGRLKSCASLRIEAV